MNTKPILFSTKMVQAILADRKTQTRRTKGLEHINKNAHTYIYDGLDQSGDEGTEHIHYFEIIDQNQKPTEKYVSVKCPYKIGNILWVRESFNFNPILQTAPIFKADSNIQKFIKWKPSIHMPKEACRLFLKVKDIRAERLREISENDSKNEGAEFLYYCYGSMIKENFKNWETHYKSQASFRMGFQWIWENINGEKSWYSNPWVWVIEFERIEKPENF